MAGRDSGEVIAHVYAQALFDVAAETDGVTQTEQELLALDAVLDKDPYVRRFFETPTVRFDQKRTVLMDALGGLSQPLLNFLLLLIKHERTNLLNQIVDIFHEHANAKAGIAEFDLTSACALETEELEELKAVLRRKFQRDVAVREAVAPDLLGGLVLKHKDWLWDVSIEHRLRRLVSRIEAFKGGLATWAE